MDHDELLLAPYTQAQAQAQVDALPAEYGALGAKSQSMIENYVSGKPSNAVVIFDHQHSLRARRRRHRDDGFARRSRDTLRHRKQDRHGGPEPHLAVNPDVTAALLHDAVAGGEAQAGALSLALGREDRFEEVRTDVVGHAGPGVRNGQGHIVAGSHFRMGRAVFVADVQIRGLDDKPSPVGHGVPGVDGQVDQQLLNLAWVRLDDIQTLAKLRHDLDVLAEETPQHLDRSGNHGT